MPRQTTNGHSRNAAGALETYEMVDVPQSAWPTRSRLYSLPPCGSGTAYVESISSYTSRLAQAHGLTIRQLISGEIRPLFGMSDHLMSGKDFATAICKEDARALCGVRNWSIRWVRALETLTLRTDLRFTTMLPWAKVISHVDLIRRERAWCPECFEAWRRERAVVYDPLLWALQEVKICLNHRQRLSVCCPNARCRKTQRFLASRMSPGYCHSCDTWLGQPLQADVGKDKISQKEMVWQSWVVQRVGELLVGAAQVKEPQPERIVYALTTLADQMTDCSLTGLARKIQRDPAHFRALLAGRHTPTLGTLLRLCYVTGLTPLQFLTQVPLVVEETEIGTSANVLFPARRCKVVKRDNCALQRNLEKMLQSDESSPPSMREMGRRLDCDPHYLYRRFPEPCKAISQRYLAFREEQKKRRAEQLQDRVRAAVQELHRRGKFPSRSAVSRFLKTTIIWTNRAVYGAWQRAVQELGWVATPLKA